MIGVRARRLAGTSGNGYGITFRYRDSRNYYWFNITNEGGRSLNRVNGEWVRLVWPKDTEGIISPGVEPHRGHVHRRQRRVRSPGLVGQREAARRLHRQGSLEPAARVGLFGYNAGEGPSRWTYDDFSVWELRG